ncbi:MAG: hypothetical protein A2X94_13555 [Bdellovibrionales bacterium GWB1_55_8]|nr:MAG: hypothetical protein A2X94_13555 [Bdellovibrionales bacterium GWB1_55_8]
MNSFWFAVLLFAMLLVGIIDAVILINQVKIFRYFQNKVGQRVNGLFWNYSVSVLLTLLLVLVVTGILAYVIFLIGDGTGISYRA